MAELPKAVLPNSTHVTTVKPAVPTTGWTEKALAQRRWGTHGIVTDIHRGHGLCYDVQHTDGTTGSYEPSELVLGWTP